MTINTKHKINCPTLTEAQRKLDLYFCLPPGLYENFKEEGFEWVKQRVRVYALVIPLVLPYRVLRDYQGYRVRRKPDSEPRFFSLCVVTFEACT
jgi:hypothetical protein